MTNDQKKVLTDFEARVRQLMFMCEDLKRENAELKEQLTAKSELYQSALVEIKELHTKYDNLKIARVISVKHEEIKTAKQRLSKLVREVDKCIALLNE